MMQSWIGKGAVFAAGVFAGTLGALLAPAASAAVQGLLNIVTCSSSTTACAGGANTSSGPGVEGTSARGKGVVGQTHFNSTAASNGQFGVFGQDLSTSGQFDEGVRGKSARGMGVHGLGNLGVVGESNSNSGADFEARGTAGALLISGFDPTGNNTFLVNSSGDVYASNVNGQSITGVDAQSGGIGVYGDGSYAAVYATNAINAPNSAAFYAAGAGGKLYVGRSSGGGPVFEVDDAGNVIAHSFNAGFAAQQTTAGGAKVMTYATESRSAILEDFGEAQLVAGSAYVRVDPSFAALMLPGSTYAVFVTPLGPVRGTLYVAQKALSGFTVRETAPGTSSVAFDYRIMARRYVPAAPRNPDVRIPAIPPPARR
jgi:hypothetical protein